MMADPYRERLKAAGWGWMEDPWFRNRHYQKDRRMGRREKRSARQEVRREIAAEVTRGR
jgi:hypothetical protein